MKLASKFRFIEETYRPVKREEIESMKTFNTLYENVWGEEKYERIEIKGNEKYFMTSSARVSFVGTNSELQVELGKI